MIFAAVAFIAIGCEKPPPSGESPAHVAEPQSTVQVNAVTWPNAGTIDRLALAALSTDAKSSVSKAWVPVLVPGDPKLLAAVVIVVGDDWYACNAKVGGLTVHVEGNRASHSYPGIAPTQGTRSIRTSKGFVTTNEGIKAASWIENGVAYDVNVECFDREDARCLGDDFVLQTAESLRYVGGAGQGQ